MSSDEHDEIDIEEHDVLDDPRLRHLLPELDLTLVKTEAPDCDEYPETPDPGYVPFSTDYAQSRIDTAISVSNSSSGAAEYTRHHNKIILGSKPSSKLDVAASNSSEAGSSVHGKLCIKEVERNGESVLVFGRKVNIKQELNDDSAKPMSSMVTPESDPRRFNASSRIHYEPDMMVMIDSDALLNNGSQVSDDDEDVDMVEQVDIVNQNQANVNQACDNNQEHDAVDEEQDRNEENGVIENQERPERIPENCRVLLENWGPKLERSSCYCKDCEILFATRNVLDAHKMACHSFLVALDVNRAFKSTSKAARVSDENLKACAQCNKKFANDSLLLAHVYGHLASKIPSKDKEKGSLIAKFDNRISLGSKAAPSEDSDIDFEESMSGYFQCSVCSFYTRDKTRYSTHSMRNHFILKPDAHRVEYSKNCRFCAFKNSDANLYNHHIQSKHAEIFFQKAGKKSTHSQFKANVPVVAGMPSSEKFQCTICSAVLKDYSVARAHRNKEHPEMKSRAILRKFICKVAPKKPDAPTATQLKRKADVAADNPKKPRLEAAPKKHTIYYCGICKNTMLGKRHVALHIEGRCVPALAKKRVICETCGLAYSTSPKHKKFHQMNPKATIHDIEFVKVQTNKAIDAPTPNYPNCKKCGVRMLRKRALEAHECGEASKTCRHCKMQFTEEAYRVHIQFHNYVKAGSSAKREIAPRQTEEIPEILKTYQMLTETWNLLYHCAICAIVTDSYDKAVEHSQNHFNHLESYDVTIKQCHICELMFDEPCLERHLEIHKDNANLNKGSFRILNYDYTKLLTNEWFDLFGTLPNVQIEQIVSKSIYAHCRSVKMTVFLDGAPSLTLYQCGSCRLYVHPPSVPKHSGVMCSKKHVKNYCGTCHIPFCTPIGKDAHVATHRSRGTYRHVIFNAEEDTAFNEALAAEKEKLANEIPIAVKSNRPAVYAGLIKYGKRKRSSDYRMYRCSKCQVCLHQRGRAATHRCESFIRKRTLVRCERCDILISMVTMRHHKMRHQEDKLFVRENIAVIQFTHKTTSDGRRLVVFSKSADCGDRVATLLKCRCGLHFTSPATYEKHSQVCSPSTKIAKGDCSKCGHVFDTNELFRHNCKHHSSDKYVKFVIREPDNGDEEQSNGDSNASDNEANEPNDDLDAAEETGKPKLYRCGVCKLLFNDKAEIVNHLPVCDPKARTGKKCARCGLSFHSNTLTHVLRVADCKRLTENDYDVSTLYPREMSASGNKQNWLYKCQKCDVHWLSQRALVDYHYVQMNHKIENNVGKCKYCRLKFCAASLMKHIKKHHLKMKLELKDIHIEVVSDKITKVGSKTDASSLTSHASSMCRLYKCTRCLVHFFSSRATSRHKAQNKCGILPTTKCARCGLLFLASTLPTHISIHHDSLNLKRKDLDVYETRLRNDHGPANAQPPTFAVSKKGLTKLTKKQKSLMNNGKYSRNLYYCQQCPLKFLSKYALKSHHFRSAHDQEYHTCPICKYSFSAASVNKHQYVHHDKMGLRRKDFRLISRLGNEPADAPPEYPMQSEDTEDKDKQRKMNTALRKIKNLKVDMSIYSNLIYKCKICSVHFITRGGYRTHVKRRNHTDQDIGECSICGLVFGVVSLRKHMYVHHKRMKLTRDDINISCGDKTDPIPDAHFKPALPESIEKKTDLTTISHTLHKCTGCNRHFLYKGSIKEHGTRCLDEKYKKKSVINCSVCGLTFSRKTLYQHVLNHHEKLKLQRKDFNIVEYFENEPIVSPMEPTKKANKKNRTAPTLSEAARAEIDISKYDNKLFKCMRCGRHFLNKISRSTHDLKCYDKSIRQVDDMDCSVCGLSFSPITLAKHQYIHHEMLNLEVDDLEIIKHFKSRLTQSPRVAEESDDATPSEVSLSSSRASANNPRKSSRKSRGGDDISEASFNLSRASSVQNLTGDIEASDRETEDRPATPISTTIERKYKSERACSAKVLKAIDLSCYDNKVFKCTICGFLAIIRDTLLRHVDDHRHLSKSTQLVTCPICELKFTSHILPKHDYIQHGKLGFKKEDMQIVTYDELQRTLYRCAVCCNHYMAYETLKNHACDRNRGRKCIICDLDFSEKALNGHYEKHHSKMKLSSDELIIVDYVSGAKKNSKVTQKDATETSDTIEQPSTSKQVASLAPNDPEKVTHTNDISQNITSPHELGDEPELEMSTLNSSLYNNNLFKCNQCSLHFLAKENFEWHLRNSDHVSVRKIHCTTCNLAFSAQTLPTHTFIHHEKMKLSVGDFVVTDSAGPTEDAICSNDDSVVSQSSDEATNDAERDPTKTVDPPQNVSSSDAVLTNKQTKLYKCGECNVHYLSQATCYKHIYKNHTPLDPFDYIACKVCGLQFGNMSLPKHVTLHHKNKEFNLDEVLVEEYKPNQDGGTPKIEIYLAIDKVQSKLVSTTTEKDVLECSTSESNTTTEKNVLECSTSEGNKDVEKTESKSPVTKTLDTVTESNPATE